MLHRDTHTPIPPFEQQLTIGPVALAADGESLYWLSRLLNLASTSRDLLQIVKHLGRFGIGRGIEDKRPPIETGNGENDFVENGWIGKVLAIGDAVRLSITAPCARCVMTTLAQGDLPKDAGILRTAAQHNHANVGIYASVLQGGTVRRGDSVKLE